MAICTRWPPQAREGRKCEANARRGWGSGQVPLCQLHQHMPPPLPTDMPVCVHTCMCTCALNGFTVPGPPKITSAAQVLAMLRGPGKAPPEPQAWLTVPLTIRYWRICPSGGTVSGESPELSSGRKVSFLLGSLSSFRPQLQNF